ncbi:MAG: alpha/beta hydrolase, partial [Bdellovibrionales bacterium]
MRILSSLAVLVMILFSVAQADASWSVEADFAAWAKSRPAPCALDFDSKYLRSDREVQGVALVLHGYSSNPGQMSEVMRILLESGYNVMAPRFKGHFNVNLRDLDSARGLDWLNDAEQAFALARREKLPITLVGYSLGGLLASWLALRYPAEVEKLILLAPALRITPRASIASVLANLFGWNLNDLNGTRVACDLNHAYIPASGGREIEHLLIKMERWLGGTYPFPHGSAFKKINVPTLMFTGSQDEAVGLLNLDYLCVQNPLCSQIVIEGANHHGVLKTLSEVRNQLLRDWLIWFVRI